MFDDLFFDKAYKLSREGRIDEALEMLNSVPEDHSEYPRALFYKSAFMAINGDDEQSGELFNRSLKEELARQMSMEPSEVAYEFGKNAFEAGESDVAVAYFDECLKRDPDFCEALHFKALALMDLEKFDEAAETIDQAIALDEDNVELWTDKATILDSIDDALGAEECFKKAKKLDSNDNHLLLSLNVFYFNHEKYNKALECINKAIKLYPDNVENYLAKAKFYYNIDDYENAEKYFDAAEELDPDNFELLMAHAVFYFSIDKYEKSIEYADKCLEVDENADFMIELKLAAIQALGDSDLMDKTLNKLSETNPEFIMSLLGAEEMPLMYDDGENKVFDMRSSDFSVFDDTNGYTLENIRYGKDYPSESMNYNLFLVLTDLKEMPSLRDVFDDVFLVGGYSDEMIANVLSTGGFIKPAGEDNLDIEKIVSAMDPPQLSYLLSKHGITASGKKKKLVKLALENVPSYEFVDEFELTSEGEEFLKDFAWFECYEQYLLLFELSDISKYIEEHEGRDIDLILEYLTKHIALAHEKEDYEYLCDSHAAKSGIYRYDKNYEACLVESLKTFILLLNPVYSYDLSNIIDLMFTNDVVEYIHESLKRLDDVNLKALFDELWDEKDSEKDFCTKDEGFVYLKRLLSGDDEDALSEEYRKKYLGIDS